jgi:hypothetical protein
MRKAWPTARLVHVPVHASWLGQAEIFFSILQRKVLIPNDLTDLDALAERVLAFKARYNATPFAWTFTRTDLDRLLARIAAHETAPATTLTARTRQPRTSGRPLSLVPGDRRFAPEEHRHPVIFCNCLSGLLYHALFLDGLARLLARGLPP